MRRYLLPLLLLLLALAGCTMGGTETDYPAAIMVEDSIYYLSAEASPMEVAESAIIGYTNSYTDSFPEKNWETNFSRELHLPVAAVEGTIAILYENEWHLCLPKN